MSTVQNGGGTRVGFQTVNYDTEISAYLSGLTQNTNILLQNGSSGWCYFIFLPQQNSLQLLPASLKPTPSPQALAQVEIFLQVQELLILEQPLHLL